jgi:transcriptional regulator with XRE-family HTH domain
MSKSKAADFRDLILDDPEAVDAYAERRLVLELARGISEARRGRQLKQQALGALAGGIRQSEISEIESGNLPRGPTAGTLMRLARGLGVNITIRFGANGTAEADFETDSSLAVEEVGESL